MAIFFNFLKIDKHRHSLVREKYSLGIKIAKKIGRYSALFVGRISKNFKNFAKKGHLKPIVISFVPLTTPFAIGLKFAKNSNFERDFSNSKILSFDIQN